MKVYTDDGRDGIDEAAANNANGIAGVQVAVYNRDGELAGLVNTLTGSPTPTDLGLARFPGLADGDYRIEVSGIGSRVVSRPGPDNAGLLSFVTISGGAVTQKVGLRPISGGPPATDPAAPIGFREITTRVWDDLDADGLQDAGEPALGGQIELLDTGNTVVTTVTGSPDGIYSFNVPVGSGYKLRFVGGAPAGYILTPIRSPVGQPQLAPRNSDANIPSSGALAGDIIISLPGGATGVNVDSLDIGFARGAVRGFVWRDLDNNGTYDAGEPRINGVEVQLLDSGNSVVQTVQTRQLLNTTGVESAGIFDFVGVPLDDTYTVRVPSSQFTGTAILAGAANSVNGADDQATPDGSGTADRDRPTITIDGTDPGTSNRFTNQHFGFYKGSVGDLVWLDLNADGVVDPTEPGLNGVLVFVDLNGNNILDAGELSDTTDNNPFVAGQTGYYRFDDLPLPGTYTIVLDQSNFASGGVLEGFGTSTGNVVDLGGGTIVITQTSQLLDAPTDFVDLDVDFGMTRSTIGNFVFVDVNGNGLFDETATDVMQGVTVRLYRAIDDTPVVTTTTDATGIYSFTDQLAGEYYATFDLSTSANSNFVGSPQLDGVTVDPPEAIYTDHSDLDGTFATVDGNWRTPNFIIPPSTPGASNNPGIDAGFYGPVEVSGRAFFDTDFDDLYTSGTDVDLANIEVSLNHAGPNGILGDADDLTPFTATTGIDGIYVFTPTLNIPPGLMRVTVTNPEPTNFQFVAQSANLGDATNDSDVDATGVSPDIVLGSGGVQTDVNAGFYGQGEVNGYTFEDNDGNGLSGDALDADLPGVQVDLTLDVDLSAYGAAALTTVGPITVTSGVTGTYSFDRLATGNFTVTFTEPAGYQPTFDDVAPTQDSDGLGIDPDQLNNQPLAAGATEARDKGYVRPVEVSGRVFFDADDDAVDTGGSEPGVENVTVTLTQLGPDGALGGGDDNVYTETTGVDGTYVFSSTREIPPGTVVVSVTNPSAADFQFVAQDSGGDDTIDSDVAPTTGETAPITLTAGSAVTDVDAGLTGTTAVSGATFLDGNGNGLSGDVEDSPLDGATVVLSHTIDFPALGLAGITVPRPAAVTASGVYSFTNLPGGTFSLEFTPPGTEIPTFDDVAPTQDSDGVGTDPDQLNDQPLTGGTDEARDKGYVQPIEVSGKVFFDADNDAVDTGGAEPGVENVAVTLTQLGPDGVLGGGDDSVYPETTGVDGTYTFSSTLNIPPGTAVISFTNPSAADFQFVAQDSGGDDTIDSDVDPALGQTAPFTVASGSVTSDVDAGLTGTTAVSGITFVDGNGNGLSGDADDGPFDGVTVVLTHTIDFPALGLTGITVPRPAALTAGGVYSFTNLPGGTFSLGFAPPAGVLATFDDVAPTQDSDGVGTGPDQLTDQPLTGGADEARDKGYVQPVEVSGKVFFDADNDAVDTGGAEPGVENVTVTLTQLGPDGALGGGDDSVYPETTGVDGTYTFSSTLGISPGTAVISVTNPSAADFQFVAQDSGGDDTIDSDVAPALGQTDPFTVTSGSVTSDVDAGLTGTTAVSGITFVDGNGNGLSGDAEDSPLDGVTVVLTHTIDFPALGLTGIPVPRPAAVTAGGVYSFTNLPAGTFSLDFVPPAGSVATFDDVAPTQDSDGLGTGPDQLTDQPLTGGTDEARDKGYIQPIEVSGKVFFDADNDAVDTGGAEPGLGNIDVELIQLGPDGVLGGGDDEVYTETTGVDGTYVFSSTREILPGTVVISVTNPDVPNFQFVAQDSGGDDTIDSDVDPALGQTAPFTVTSGTMTSDVDAGFTGRGSVSGYTFEDVEYDGQSNAPADALGGVTVTLTMTVDLSAYGVAAPVPIGPLSQTTSITPTSVYSFTNLPAGTFGLVFTPPTADPLYVPTLADTGAEATDSDSDLTGQTLAAGANEERDQGYVQPARITARVFDDGNNNNEWNAGEVGLAGVSVTLTPTPTVVFSPTFNPGTTDADGFVEFLVTPGTYDINVDEGTLPAGYTASTGNTNPLTLPALGSGESSLTEETTPGTTNVFGYYTPALVSGQVFFDGQNAEPDNLKDNDPDGLEGVTVRLTDTGGTPVGGLTATTDVTGTFTITDVAPGDYLVEFVNPDPTNFTFNDSVTGDNTVATIVGDDGRTDVISVTSGITLTQDAAVRGLSTVEGFTFVDSDVDGLSTGTEDTPLDGVTVTLTVDVNITGTLSTTISRETTSASGGTFNIPDLPGGTGVSFDISFTPPAATPPYTVTLVDQAAEPSNDDSDGELTGQPLGTGETVARQQGYYQEAIIVARVFDEQVTVDNTFEPGEVGIAGVTVALTGTTSISQTTDATGIVTFTVQPGDYTISVPTDPTDFFPSPGNTGSVGPITATSGETAPETPFGYYRNSSIEGTVWFDSNGNGTLDIDEPGMEDVTVLLLGDVSGSIISDTTDVDGLFAFTDIISPTGLAGGDTNYQICFTPTSDDFVPTIQGTPLDTDGNSDINPGAGPENCTDPFTVGSNNAIEYIDAGFVGTLSIGDLVWQDSNRNGLQDTDEQALEGAVVTAEVATTGINSTNPTIVVSTTSTTSAGLAANYALENLPPASDFTITRVDLFGFKLSPADQGDDDTLDSEPVPFAGGVLSESLTNVDFGLIPTISIGDRVWLDLNDNGTYEPGTDVGLPDVTVELLDDTDTVISTTTTADVGDIGFYQFNDVEPATYAVRFVAPTGYVFVNDGEGSSDVDNDNDAGSNGVTEDFTITESISTIDAGLRGIGSISGIAWIDENENNVRDRSENGRIPDVAVTLTFTPTLTTAPIVLTTSTAADGSYSFENLPAGTFAIEFTTPADFELVETRFGGDPTVDSDAPRATGSLDLGGNVTFIDAGYRGQVVVEVSILYLPIIQQSVVEEPPPPPGQSDLVIESFTLTPDKQDFTAGEDVVVEVVVRNQGDAPTERAFWVDLYINPELPDGQTQPQINQRWNDLCSDDADEATPCSYGIAWLVEEEVLQPGESITLTSEDLGPREDVSRWLGYFVNGTTTLYAQVDSWNPGVDTGAEEESDETNNIQSITGLSVTGDNPPLPVTLPQDIAPR